MMAFDLLSPAACTGISFWAFALCVTGIYGMMLAFRERRIVSMLSLIPVLVPGYLVWQMGYELYLYRGGSLVFHSRSFAGLSAAFWILLLVSETLLQSAVILRLVHHSRSNITPQAIRICSDRMPCGLCYYKENGMVIFSNSCMDRLCLSITGDTLLNGNYLRKAIPYPIFAVEDKIWRFSFRKLQLDGELLHEIIASDVTEIYKKTEELQKDNENLNRLRTELQEYNRSIEDMVRKQEILQAKIYIHDEMNRLILSTEAAGTVDPALWNNDFTLWKKNAQLLTMDARERRSSNAFSSVKDLAAALGICLSLPETLPEVMSEEEEELFFIAAREAIANASKHAKASELTVSVEEKSGAICCTFENDGVVAAGPVPFRGGLENLSKVAAEMGVQVLAKAEKSFCLTLIFPKKD